MSKASILKDLKSGLPHIKHIQDLNSFEREISYEFSKERAKRDKVRKKLFQPGNKVKFLTNYGWVMDGTVQRVLNKKIEIKAEDGGVVRINPSRMGLKKEEGATA